MSRLPLGIKKIELDGRENGRSIVRYVVTVDVGINGQRKQVQKRFRTEAEARKWQSDTRSAVKSGAYVQASKLTVEKACSEWLDSLHGIEESTLRGYKIWLAPLREALGHVEIQKLTKNQLDDLVKRLRAGDMPKRKKWKARTVNGMLWAITAVIDDLMKQGRTVRNVGHLIDRLPSEKEEMQTLEESDMYKVLDYPDRDRHLWALALYMGLRRGEIAGLRWKYVDFEARTIEIAETRICVGKTIVTKKPKSKNSRRILPMSDEVYQLLLDAHGRIESVYVACDKKGNEYHPNYVTERWGQVLKLAGVAYVRLHDARHTCATLMHFKGVPIAVVSKWLGHSTVTITASTYLHSQDEQLKSASSVFTRN